MFQKSYVILFCAMTLMFGSAFAYDTVSSWGVKSDLDPLATPSLYTNTSAALGWVWIPEDPEFVEALAWMYTNNITSLWTASTYRPFDKITREEATKVLGRFAKNILNATYKTWISNEFCVFQDSGMIAKDFQKDVFDSCKMWLFRWWNGWFYPKWWLTKAQSLVVLIRLFDGKVLSENVSPWFKTYYDRAHDLWITKDRDLNNFNRDVTRYEIALMIYRFNIKYKLLKKTNGVLLWPDHFMAILPESIVNNNGLRKWTALFNTELLTHPNLDSFVIDLFGDKYMIKKRKVDNYGVWNSNYIRFWDLYTADGLTFLWSANFTVLNGSIDEAYVRPSELGGKFYSIKSSAQQPYYTIEEKSMN